MGAVYLARQDLGRHKYYFRVEGVEGEPELGAEEQARTTSSNTYDRVWLDRSALLAADLRPMAIRPLCRAALDQAVLRDLAAPAGTVLRPWVEGDFPAIQSLSAAEGWTTPTERSAASLASWCAAWPALWRWQMVQSSLSCVR